MFVLFGTVLLNRFMAMEVISVNSAHLMENKQIGETSNSVMDKPGEIPSKKSHRRKPSKKKRKWRPYSKLSWDEKLALEEKEKERAIRMREKMLDNGHPVAPYNTTQFIMAEYDNFESDQPTQNLCSDGPNCGSEAVMHTIDDEYKDEDYDGENMENYTNSPHIVQDFISKDFSETYERVQEENLQTMTKEELMREHIELERTNNELRDTLHCEKLRVERRNKTIQELKEENKKLQDSLNSLTNIDSPDSCFIASNSPATSENTTS